MIVVAFFIALWSQNPSMYESALRKSIEAELASNDIKRASDKVQETARNKAGPILTTTAIMGYSIGVKHEFRYTTSKATIVPGTVTTVSANKTNASLSLTWGF